jgi:hypothetical protein
MFGLGNKLLTDGAQAKGVVIKCKMNPGIADNIVPDYHVTVRVKFDDGSTKEFKQKLNRYKVGGFFTEGTILPVRYDPDNHSKVEIDIPAVTGPPVDYDAENQERIARAEAAIAQGTTSTAGAVSPPVAPIPTTSGGTDLPTDDEMAAAFAASMAANTDRTAMDAFWAAKSSGDVAEQKRLKVVVAEQNAQAQALNKEFQRMSALRPDWHR